MINKNEARIEAWTIISELFGNALRDHANLTPQTMTIVLSLITSWDLNLIATLIYGLYLPEYP